METIQSEIPLYVQLASLVGAFFVLFSGEKRGDIDQRFKNILGDGVKGDTKGFPGSHNQKDIDQYWTFLFSPCVFRTVHLFKELWHHFQVD